MSSTEGELYQDRIPIFPRSVKGFYRNLKYVILLIAYGTYFLLPWLPWQRANEPNQTILFDIINGRFYIFNLLVYAQDIFWLAGFLIIAAFLLFFVTGIAGRVFCGYFCFQTLWTDVFLLVERLVQGERNARMKLASSPWTTDKVARMSLTWLLWLLVAFWTGISFTFYWESAPVLFMQFFTGSAPFPAYATTLFLTLTTFVMAGLAREQVCTYMCPYARFQGAMFDEDTLVVSYNEQRGERQCGRCKPEKGNKKHGERIEKKIGDCIDCGYCVQVCPVGIDIRNGMQYQCISCALCIDACNTIMTAINYPAGLIRYTSARQLRGNKKRWFTFKNIGYGSVLIVATVLLVFSIINRAATEFNVQQIRSPLYVLLSDGSIQNRYQIRIKNKLDKQMSYSITVKPVYNLHWEVSPAQEVVLAAGQISQVQLKVWARPEDLADKEIKLEVVLMQSDKSEGPLVVQTSFFSPKTGH